MDSELTQEIKNEAELAVQEWGVKNNLRLLGITVAEYGEPGKGHDTLKPRAKSYFVDAAFKNMFIYFFDIKTTSGKITVSRGKAFRGIKWPIKIMRTRTFMTDKIDPVYPLYDVLVNRKIIMPFKGTMKKKEWDALPFEEMGNMKPVEA